MSRLSRIEEHYIPAFDTPGAGQPPVTWVEYDLMCEIQKQQKEIDELKSQLAVLNLAVESIYNRIK